MRLATIALATTRKRLQHAPMSKSLARVAATLESAGLACEILEMPGETRTAGDAAREAGCEIDQIAKSIVFRGEESDLVVLFITAGGNRVDGEKASKAAGEALSRADANFVRERTGFAIGGVAPVGQLTPSHVFLDPKLLEYSIVYAAAGTPRHIFAVAPTRLAEIAGARVAEFTT